MAVGKCLIFIKEKRIVKNNAPKTKVKEQMEYLCHQKKIWDKEQYLPASAIGLNQSLIRSSSPFALIVKGINKLNVIKFYSFLII